MSKKEKKLTEEETVKSIKLKKKKKSPYEKRKVIMKIFGIIMAIIMVLGTILSIVGMLFL